MPHNRTKLILHQNLFQRKRIFRQNAIEQTNKMSSIARSLPDHTLSKTQSRQFSERMYEENWYYFYNKYFH